MVAKKNKKTNKNFIEKPPIVVILGHVDHGKTSILDYIRHTKVVEKETGGITQHIGAYQVEHNGKLITFIDTPGHEAFSAMRSRGARVADLAVLVIAAEEGLKPQTKEAIKHIKKGEMPFVVALNKIDKPEAQPERVKKQLSENDVLVESYGGTVPTIETSAKSGKGIDELLEMIILLAEMEQLQTDPAVLPTGTVIESYLDSKSGPTATLLVKDGVLKSGHIIVTESTYGHVKNMYDFRGNLLREAPASTPVRIIGLYDVPFVGEKWKTAATLDEARQEAKRKAEIEKEKREPASVLEISPDKKVLNIILKADVLGTLEAIRESLKSIPQDKVLIRILEAGAGDITESDIKLAASAKARIFGFRVKEKPGFGELIKRLGVKIETGNIIYELIQAIRASAADLLEPEIIKHILGRIKILATFKIVGSRQIVGGKVIEGKIEKGTKIDILRNEEYVGSGRLAQLQKNKKDVDFCRKGDECGVMYEGEGKIEIGDILEFYKEEKKKQEL